MKHASWEPIEGLAEVEAVETFIKNSSIPQHLKKKYFNNKSDKQPPTDSSTKTSETNNNEGTSSLSLSSTIPSSLPIAPSSVNSLSTKSIISLNTSLATPPPPAPILQRKLITLLFLL